MDRLFALVAAMLFATAPMAAPEDANTAHGDSTERAGPEDASLAPEPTTGDPPADLPPHSEGGRSWNAASPTEPALPPAVAPPALETPPPASPERGAPMSTPPAFGRAAPLAEFNRVSLYGAPTLGTMNRGLGAYLGFPLLGARVAIGASPFLDLGAGFDSFYGSMNELRLFGKYLIRDERSWTISVTLEGGAAMFAQKPEAEGHGPRWLTGRRNFNVECGAVMSYRGASVQSARLFLDVRYHLAIDTQPYAQTPLGGIPPTFQLGHNLPVRMGAEMPFSPRASFLFVFGFEIHGRTLDSRFMPVVGVGLVTGI
jgi:hypothetical protein